MSRSLGHRPYKKTDGYEYFKESLRGPRPARRKHGAVAWHTLYTLRYPEAEAKKAAEEGRKPRAQKLRRETVSYIYGRGLPRGVTAIQVYMQKFESSARRRERDAAVKAVKTANTRKRPEFDPSFDIEPYRTRHTALWDAP